MLEELIGIWGDNKAEVVQRIVEHFFINPKSRELLEMVREWRQKVISQTPTKKTLEKKISEFLEIADCFSLDFFIEYLDLEKRIVFSNLYEWSKKFGFKIIDRKIVKNR